MASNSPIINALDPAVKSTSGRKTLHHPRLGARTVSAIIAKRATGSNKAKIAKELGISRTTVHAVLADSVTERNWTQELQAIVPDAISSVHKQIQTGDGDLGMRYIEQVVLRDDNKAKSFADNRLQIAVGTLIATEAAAKAPPVSKSDQVHTQNLPFFDAKVLETRQLAENNAQLSFSFMEDP